MNTAVKPLVTRWSAEPRRTGFAWFLGNTVRLFGQLRVYALTRFISFLGAVSTPGMKPIGILQAWALRAMGVQCASSEVWIGPDVSFDYPRNVVLGRRIVIGADSRLTARSEIRIGDDFLSAPGLQLNTGTHDPETLVPLSSPITIGPGVWCGTRVTVCAGVTIGAGAIVGAASLVLKDLPPWHLAFGVPCKPQRAFPERPAASRWSNFNPQSGDRT